MRVELPEEDNTEADRHEDRVGQLMKSTYGTRDAAMNWQEEIAKEMKQWGFQRGKSNPCLYWHPSWKVRTLVHGDDFVSVGSRESIKRFNTKLRNRFSIKTYTIGPGGTYQACHNPEVQEGKVLNRIIRCTAQGYELEADPRHAEMVIDALGLTDAKGVSSPGEAPKKHEEGAPLEATATAVAAAAAAAAGVAGAGAVQGAAAAAAVVAAVASAAAAPDAATAAPPAAAAESEDARLNVSVSLSVPVSVRVSVGACERESVGVSVSVCVHV